MYNIKIWSKFEGVLSQRPSNGKATTGDAIKMSWGPYSKNDTQFVCRRNLEIQTQSTDASVPDKGIFIRSPCSSIEVDMIFFKNYTCFISFTSDRNKIIQTEKHLFQKYILFRKKHPSEKTFGNTSFSEKHIFQKYILFRKKHFLRNTYFSSKNFQKYILFRKTYFLQSDSFSKLVHFFFVWYH
jgi:hypothetical protein